MDRRMRGASTPAPRDCASGCACDYWKSRVSSPGLGWEWQPPPLPASRVINFPAAPTALELEPALFRAAGGGARVGGAPSQVTGQMEVVGC